MDIIAEYVAFMAGGGRGPGGDELRRRARERLLSSGWTLYKFAKCDGRQELRYRAPHGASYISLIVACKKFQLFSAAPPRPAAPRGKPSKKRAAPDCSSGFGKGKEIARVLRYRVFGSGEEDECAPAVRNPFSGECRARHRKMRRVSALYADDALEKFAARKRKKASASPRSSASSPAASPQSPASPAASPARVLRPRPKDGDKAQAAAACLQPTRARTILAVLMDKKILPPTAKLSYRRTRDGPPVKQGTVTAQGTIRCACGCGGKAFTVAEFAAHAGGCGTERPSASVYLNDGRSLSECLVQLMRAHGGSNRTTCSSSPRARLKRRCPPELEDGDWVCSVCADFGDMLLCDCCPSAFHHGCVGLDATPQGEWFCPSCRCAACGSSEFEPADGGEFTDKTVIYCDQCELEYHAGCVRGRGDHQLERRPEGPWLCGHDCSNIFQRLQGLVGRSMPTSVDGVTFTVLRSSKLPEEEEEEAMAAEEHGRLCAAFDVLHECFITLIEPQTRTDLSHDVVFNRESELRRLNFRGFYVVGLEKGGELITVGTLRVYGKKVAELPLVGTRFVHRRQGMCRLLINQLEKLLGELGVERLVLPAVPELLPTWTGSFGFRPMSHSDRAEIAEHTVMCFQGTTMCQKFITSAAAS